MGWFSRALLYARTARHLRWEQWVYRPLRRIQQRFPRVPTPAGSIDPARWARLGEVVAGWGDGDPVACVRRADEVVEGVFRFLNHTETLREIDWGKRYVSHLWSYNLQYFDYALDLARAYRITGDPRYARRFEHLAEGWIRGTTPGHGDGWEPYPISLRVVNWIYSLLLFGDAVDPSVRGRIEASLLQQLGFLERRLEYHILANHLQKNLKALVIGGIVFSGRAAERWRKKGGRLLWRELGEQVLPDGVHYERSPMYHAIALADFLEVIALLTAAGEPVGEEVRSRVRGMVEAFGVLSRPDGSLHLFNDAANGIAPGRSWIDSLARTVLGGGITHSDGLVALVSAGYFGFIDSASRLRLIVDCGEPGPEYQPGHAHCDLLSFELDVDRRPVIVDSGVSGYEGDPLREYVRSTRAHNTVVIGGREQSEIWGTFRVARRARVLAAGQRGNLANYCFQGAYSPYHDRRVAHHRLIERKGAALTITDSIEGAYGAPLSSFVHVHPDFAVEREGERYVLRHGGSVVVIHPFGVDRSTVEIGARQPPQGWYCPEFGVAIPAPVLRLDVDRNDGRPFGYTIELVKSSNG